MHYIDHHPLRLDIVHQLLAKRTQIALSDAAQRRMEECRYYLEAKVADSDHPIYGINTGFGALCDAKIDRHQMEELQRNLVMSHACGAGAEVPEEVVRLMLLFKIQGLSLGHSGVTVALVERLIWHYNEGVLPVVYTQGSLGASGDLAPLAHLSLPLLGMGQVRVKAELCTAAEVLEKNGMKPLVLRSKEGLALLNGTQFMSAYGVHICLQSEHLLQWADVLAALSLEAYDGRIEPFHEAVHRVRPHEGQCESAALVRRFLSGSYNMHKPKKHVQDPYSFRCVPQVHGASRDVLAHVRSIVEREINSVTDNPTIFPEEDVIISAGNFHGQPLAMAFDYAAIALAELGSISERRVFKLIAGVRGLPAFLVSKPGLNSGFMIPQYTAAGIVSRNKQLCTPCSVDSIDSSNGQEDHVSMGANAAVKCLEVLNNLKTLFGIELLNACQALEFRGLEGVAPAVRALHADFRQYVSALDVDRPLYTDMAKATTFINTHEPATWMNN